MVVMVGECSLSTDTFSVSLMMHMIRVVAAAGFLSNFVVFGVSTIWGELYSMHEAAATER